MAFNLEELAPCPSEKPYLCPSNFMCFGPTQYCDPNEDKIQECLPPMNTLEWCRSNKDNTAAWRSPQCGTACYSKFNMTQLNPLTPCLPVGPLRDDSYPVEVWIYLGLLIVFAVLALIEGVWLYRKHKSEYTPIGQDGPKDTLREVVVKKGAERQVSNEEGALDAAQQAIEVDPSLVNLRPTRTEAEIVQRECPAADNQRNERMAVAEQHGGTAPNSSRSSSADRFTADTEFDSHSQSSVNSGDDAHGPDLRDATGTGYQQQQQATGHSGTATEGNGTPMRIPTVMPNTAETSTAKVVPSCVRYRTNSFD